MQEDKNAIFQMRFPHKLWYLLNMRTDAILWGGSDVQDEFGDDDSISGDWLIPNSENNDMQKEQNLPVLSAEKPQENNYISIGDGFQNFGDKSQDTLMGFSDDSCQQNVDNFPGQFLNMPDLDPVPSESSGVELLAEFNIGDENRHDIVTKMVTKPIDHQFLNCVLPSISNDQNDDVSMTERHDENMTHYHSEWDQMFNDIIINKSSAPESSSNLKELYTQISQTIHL
ncbi:hypothetical protein RR48_11527 [Papilio machaon]|uniref:Uncharacterized protein n=1 Tax=Papilio machaon TaxID=76193 RepID=A0A194R8S2_PAPMA|nr:hypothetical protein RR48_11527 [Papilio machaon]